MLDVLVARIASGAHLLLDRGVDALLQLEFLRHRLDDEIGGADAIATQVRNEPIERVADIGAFVADLAVELGWRA